MNRHVKLTITTLEGVVLDSYFVSVPESDLSADVEITETIVDRFDCAETIENLLKLDALNAMDLK